VTDFQTHLGFLLSRHHPSSTSVTIIHRRLEIAIIPYLPHHWHLLPPVLPTNLQHYDEIDGALWSLFQPSDAKTTCGVRRPSSDTFLTI